MKFVFGNWKMQLSLKAGVALAKELVKNVKVENSKLAVALFPAFDALESVHVVLDGSAIALGAQDCFWEEKGADTGEESPVELKEIGCTHVIVGHSERRTKLGETDEMVGKKLTAALKVGLIPVLCVGESETERANGQWTQVLDRQVRAALAGVKLAGKQKLFIAYEPVWAIGTGKACAPADARDAHVFIGNILSELYGAAGLKAHFHIIYGGSVDAKNIASYLNEEGIDGALVGGASQKSATFLPLIAAASK